MKRVLVIGLMLIIGIVGVGASASSADGGVTYYDASKTTLVSKPFAVFARTDTGLFWFGSPQFK